MEKQIRQSRRGHYDYMMIALIPIVVCAVFVYSARVLLVTFTAMLTARITDVLVAYVRGVELDVNDKSSSVAALTFALMLPVSIPLYMVVMDVALVIFVGKHVFGGRGAYPFNLAALAMCVAVVNWPLAACRVVTPFSSVDFWSGNARQATSNIALIRSGGLPYTSLMNLLLGNYPGSMGTAYAIIIMAVFVALLLTRKVTWHAPVAFVATIMLIALIFPRISGVDRLTSIKYEVLSSAVLYYRVFLLNEPTTTPKKKLAKLVFGIVCGILTMLFRYFGAYEIGGCFAILLANATEGMWDRLVPRMAGDDVTAIYRPQQATVRTSSKKKDDDRKTRTAAVKTYESSATSAEDIVRKIAREAKESERRNARKAAEETAAARAKEEAERNTARTAEEIAARIRKQDRAEQAPEGRKTVNSNGRSRLSRTKDRILDSTAFNIIGRVEDEIDEVEFSTRTIDVEELLRAIREQGGDGWKK